MKTLFIDRPYLLTLVLILGALFLSYNLIKERERNEPYRRELENLKTIIQKSETEKQRLENELKALYHPLSLEKERKEKFGENLKDEKMMLIAEEVLKNIELFK